MKPARARRPTAPARPTPERPLEVRVRYAEEDDPATVERLVAALRWLLARRPKR